jgi:hypothetical protein
MGMITEKTARAFEDALWAQTHATILPRGVVFRGMYVERSETPEGIMVTRSIFRLGYSEPISHGEVTGAFDGKDCPDGYR